MLAERGGFEPPVDFKGLRRFSKPLLSTTQPPLRDRGCAHQGWYHKSTASRKTVRIALARGKPQRKPVLEIAQKRKCSPGGEHSRLPWYQQGDVHGRIRFDGIATRQNLCDWILGRAGNDVKEKTFRVESALKPHSISYLAIMSVFGRLWKTCSQGVNFTLLLRLTARNVEAYLLPRCSVIMASGSSPRFIFRLVNRTAA